MHIQPLPTGFALKSNNVFGFDFYYWNDWPWTLEIFNTMNCKAQNRSTFKIKTVTTIQYLLFLASDITLSHEISHRGGWRKLMLIKHLVKKTLCSCRRKNRYLGFSSDFCNLLSTLLGEDLCFQCRTWGWIKFFM